MNIQESRQLMQTVNAAVAMVQALAAQLDRVEARLEELEQRRGPGRPPNKVANEAVQR